MSGPTYNEMEARRLEMIASFREIAAAMKHCISVIEDYARLSPHTVSAIDPSLLPTTLAAITSAHSAPGSAPAPAPTTPAVGEDGKKIRVKRPKKPKDPNAPKRPPSAYILFQNEIREEIRKKNPEMPYKDVLGIISQMWKELPDTSKKVYDAAYEDAHSQYKVNDTNYKNALEHPAPAPVVPEASDDSDSSSSDSDSDDDVPPAPVITPAPKPKAVPAAAPTPAATASVKKEKKKRNRDEAEVAAALSAVGVPTPDPEKKKKKKKEVAV